MRERVLAVAKDEFSLIRRWTSRASNQEGAGLSVGIGDDAAVFTVPDGMEVIACCDAMIETVHFLRETMAPADIGYKAIMSTISDVAAMGGIPRYALVTMGLSADWTAEECDRIYDGIYEALALYGMQLIGGDTVSTPDALHLSVSVLGEVERGRALRRSAARPGDVVFTTGRLGESAAGLHALLAAARTDREPDQEWETLYAAHRRPQAAVHAGRLLLTSGAAGALNDISDGLASELWEIAEASKVHITIEQERLPISETLRRYAAAVGHDPYRWIFYGGEDYQLVGTVDREAADGLQRQFAEHGLSLVCIGRVIEGESEPGITLCEPQGRSRPLGKEGFNHFSGAVE
ncbi:thiamine-phosphate kinase [Brevibacillus humidisoli]|uniref:thiamine-phosphate kinase n=1 Tax=Brevibacillus humidisoli TaxID=2895522 RepID=UPI001E4AB631|nr:thiamine-phosphate kinase [Brevibacillus humidisoli]UFJ40956.1 thiamine-phosphate kinase [Brevibacillus humidisoli]